MINNDLAYAASVFLHFKMIVFCLGEGNFAEGKASHKQYNQFSNCRPALRQRPAPVLYSLVMPFYVEDDQYWYHVPAFCDKIKAHLKLISFIKLGSVAGKLKLINTALALQLVRITCLACLMDSWKG